MHSLRVSYYISFYQVMNVDTNPPNSVEFSANTKQFVAHQFAWQEQSNLRSAKGDTSCAKPVAPSIVGGVHFINDVNCESTLLAIKQAVQQSNEFCVHSEASQYSLTSAPSSHPINSDQPKQASQNLSTIEHAYLQCMSSGSNGEPKRIRRTHLSWINSFRVSVKNQQLSAADSYAIIGKLSHSLTLYAALEAAWIGADIQALADVRTDKQFTALARLKSSVLYATPTQLRTLCRSATKMMQPNLTLQHIFCGGGKLDQRTFTELAKYFPNACVKEFYGASETSFITLSDQHTPAGSVGKPYPGVELKIRPIAAESDFSKSNAADCKQAADIGEIWVKSPYLFESYGAGSEQDTRWHDGFLSIGELGYVDSSGHLYLTGRRSRMINIADNIVFPEQIENVLNEHQAVRHCALIPKSDAQRGLILVAIIEADENESLRLELLRLCRKKFGALKAPRRIFFVSNLPMLAAGKPDLKTLTRQFELT